MKAIQILASLCTGGALLFGSPIALANKDRMEDECSRMDADGNDEASEGDFEGFPEKHFDIDGTKKR